LLAQIQRTLDDERGCWNRKRENGHSQKQNTNSSSTTPRQKRQNKQRHKTKRGQIEKYNKSQTKNGMELHCSDASHRIYIGYWLDKKVAIRDQKEGERDGRWTFK